MTDVEKLSKDGRIAIIGMGIAGSCLAWQLLDLGADFHVYDVNNPSSCSRLAAGIVNPVTGRRFVLSWRFAELNLTARKFYRRLERELALQILHDMPIVRNIEDQRFKDDILAKIADPVYMNYLSESDFKHEDFESSAELVEVKRGMRVDMAALIKRSREVFLERGLLKDTKVELGNIRMEQNAYMIGAEAYTKIIFCEGAYAAVNPWFAYLPFNLSKGELLTIAGDPGYDFMYKDKIFFVPLNERKVWIGSAYDWNYENELPSEEGKKKLIEKLSSFYRRPIKVLEHKAAIRPTVRDRRPFLGEHPEHVNMYIFNGLGTKGANLAPWMSEHMAGYVLGNNQLDRDVDIKRFSNYYTLTDI